MAALKSMTSPLTDAITGVLQEGPRTANQIQHALSDRHRVDNTARAIKNMLRSGKLIKHPVAPGERDPLLAVAEEGPPRFSARGAAERAIVERLRRTPKNPLGPPHRAYRQLAESFQRLATGAPQAITGPWREKFLASGLCVEFGGLLQLQQKERLQEIWKSEAAFCEFGGWAAPHADAVDRLLAGGTLLEDAAAIAECVEFIGRRGIESRTGIHHERIGVLARAAELGSDVVMLLPADVKYTHLRTLVNLPSDVERQAWLAAHGEAPEDSEEDSAELPSDFFEGLTQETEDSMHDETPEPELREMVACSLRLLAGLTDVVSDLATKVTWLTQELGMKEPGK